MMKFILSFPKLGLCWGLFLTALHLHAPYSRTCMVPISHYHISLWRRAQPGMPLGYSESSYSSTCCFYVMESKAAVDSCVEAVWDAGEGQEEELEVWHARPAWEWRAAGSPGCSTSPLTRPQLHIKANNKNCSVKLPDFYFCLSKLLAPSLIIGIYYWAHLLPL